MGTSRTCASYVSMVLVQLVFGGSNILMKISLEKGLNQLVFVVYRHLIAMLVLAPFAYAFERTKRPSLSFSIFLKIFVLAALGTTIHQNIYYLGLDYTSPTVSLALSNVIPSFTFLLAVLFGMEKLAIKNMKGQAKVLGTVTCIGGALIFTFWKGGYMFKGFVKHPLIDIYGTRDSAAAGLRHHNKHNWIKGSVLILTSHVAWSAWLILQAVICKVYPAQVSLNTLICFFASLQSSVLALVFDRNPKSWKLEWNVQLLTIIYCGVVNSALVYYLQTWCISEKGPVFVAMFIPLALIFVGIFSAVVFAERLHLGSLIGAVLIVFGLYCFLWGKSESNKNCEEGKTCSEMKSSPDHQNLEISVVNDLPIVPIASEGT